MAQPQKRRRRRVRPGDVFEVKTRNGYGYVQYVGEHSFYGETIRVLRGLFPQPLDECELRELAQKEGYYAFSPVSYAERKGIVDYKTWIELPPWVSVPRRVRLDRFTYWLIKEDDVYLYSTKQLTEEERRLPIAALWTPLLLVDRIESSYDPYEYVTPRPFLGPQQEEGDLSGDKDSSGPTLAGESAEAEPEPRGLVKHYLYFPRKRQALRLMRELRNQGLAVDGPEDVDDDTWRVLVRHHAEELDTLELRDRLEELADRYGGEYDGWEIKMG